MKVKLITVCTDPNDMGLQALNKSLDRFNWDYEVLVAPVWRGFSTKLLTVYAYLQNTDIDAIFFCDAYDCVVLGTIEEALGKIETNYGLDNIVISAEKNCWPMPSLSPYYHDLHEIGFNYVNSGVYYAPKDKYLKLMDMQTPEYSDDDQLYMTNHYLFNELSGIRLDCSQSVFNSHSFISDGEYGYENGRIQINNEQPVIIHLNGRSVDHKLNELL